MNMIPKIIHYCWFGRNQLPSMAVRCIESWRKYLPDYEIWEWNEDGISPQTNALADKYMSFNVNIISYTQEAYSVKKYAFVSDYARFWLLYKYGGLYFDTDVEVIKNMDDIIDRGPFMGCEGEASNTRVASVAPGLGLGVNPGLSFYKKMLELYSTLHFINPDGSYNQKTIVAYTTEMLCNYGLRNINEIQECAGMWIYPKDYFGPKDYYTGKLHLTENTMSIHHYDASWKSKSSEFKKRIAVLIGPKLTSWIVSIKSILKR